MRSRSAHWLLLCVAVIAFGCAKGDTGPTGPTGPPGSANVIYSDWYSPATWDAENLYGMALRTYTITATPLTQEIIDHGVVMVYFRPAGLAPEIVQLPCEFPDPPYFFFFRASAGVIKISYYNTGARTTTPPVIPSQNQLRYVLIPGGALATSASADGSAREQEIAGLKSMSYSEVCTKYGIPE